MTSAIDSLLARARSRIQRWSPAETFAHVQAGALLIDIRPVAQRAAHGMVPGALCIERNVLEWRLAPSSSQRVPELLDRDQVVIITCSAGYASSLAAASLQQVGLANATDLDGGFLAWDAAGLPVAPFGYRGQVDRTQPR